MNNQAIGFIDSGVGGLTVVKEALKQLPNENIYYLGDTARMPYGPRPSEQVLEFTWEMTSFLLSKGIKMLVIACNTATAAALDDLREKLAIPVIGVIKPGSRAAIKSSRNQRVGVIGTEGTIKSSAYKRTLHEKNPNLFVTSLPCPEFVQIVENDQYESEMADRVVSETLAFFDDKNIDTLVMGCTHYPLLRPFIQKAMGNKVTLIDSGAETVNDVSTILDYFDIAAKREEKTIHEFYTTGDSDDFNEIASGWLGLEDIDAKTIHLGQGD